MIMSVCLAFAQKRGRSSPGSQGEDEMQVQVLGVMFSANISQG